jgi:hypothetical protein
VVDVALVVTVVLEVEAKAVPLMPPYETTSLLCIYDQLPDIQMMFKVDSGVVVTVVFGGAGGEVLGIAESNEVRSNEERSQQELHMLVMLKPYTMTQSCWMGYKKT